MRLFKNIKKAVESRTVFCGTLLTRQAVEEEEARGEGGGRGRDRGEAALRRESLSTQGVSSSEREARRKKGGCGVAEASVVAAAADRLLTMDVERSKIRLAVRMISSLDEARRWFFTAPVGAAAAASTAERAVAYALDRLEGRSP